MLYFLSASYIFDFWGVRAGTPQGQDRVKLRLVRLVRLVTLARLV